MTTQGADAFERQRLCVCVKIGGKAETVSCTRPGKFTPSPTYAIQILGFASLTYLGTRAPLIKTSLLPLETTTDTCGCCACWWKRPCLLYFSLGSSM